MLEYQKAVEAVWAFGDFFERQSGHTFASAGIELDRVRRLLKLVGSPQLQFPVITVAGTKGKGSTSAIISSILAETDRRVGLYTQPHLHSYRERIRVNGEPIDPQTFTEVAEYVVNLAGQVNAELVNDRSLTAYEVGTAVALRHFAEVKVDVAVLEVGLGGRLDAVNAVDADLTVITPISRDHTAILGSTLAKIAAEKAGVMRPGQPVIIAPQRESARRQLARSARTISARPTWVDSKRLPASDEIEVDIAGGRQRFRLRTEQNDYGLVDTGLLGAHQRLNALVAAIAVESFLGFVDRQVVIAGLAKVQWPGRLELARPNSIGPLVVLDGAHNDHSAMALADSIRELFPTAPMVDFVIGVSSGKDCLAIIKALEPLARRFYATSSRHPRALPADALAQQIRKRSSKEVVVTHNVDQALDMALESARPSGLVVVTGSLFVVADARERLGLPKTKP